MMKNAFRAKHVKKSASPSVFQVIQKMLISAGASAVLTVLISALQMQLATTL